MEPTPPQDHYFAAAPSSAARSHSVRLDLPDLSVELATESGVFAHRHVDPGTKLLLLEAPHPPPGGNLVDLGSGYGAITVALARRSPDATVWAVEVNERARRLCERNASELGLANVQVVEPDGLPEGLAVDAIYSNPPIRIGKAALHSLLTDWLTRLAAGGSAYLVVQKHLGSDSLQRWLESEGWPTRRLLSRAGYRILHTSRISLGEVGGGEPGSDTAHEDG